MNVKIIVGILLIAIGGGMLFGSNYINTQVLEGRAKIQKAQKTVDTGNQLFSLNPYTEQVGKGLTKGAQKKIDAGSAEADYYENMANMLHTGGIVAIVAGAALILYTLVRRAG